MKIIGHRGAAGIAIENTKSGIVEALKTGVDAIEIDIRSTKDGVMVLNHDTTLQRVYDTPVGIADITYNDLHRIATSANIEMITLDEALDLAQKTPLIIELKEHGCADKVAEILGRHTCNASVASFHHNELRKLKGLVPGIRLIALEHHNPFEIVERSRAYGFHGIGLNFWLLNPLTYILVRRAKLYMYVYTINWVWLARFVHVLYPRIAICTDYPNKFSKYR